MDNKKEKETRLPWFGIPTMWPYIKTYKNLLFQIIAVALMVAGIDSIFPLFNRYAINHFVGNKTLDTLPEFIAAFMFLVILQAVLNYKNVLDLAKMEMFTNRDLRNSAFAHLQELSLSYYNANNVGYIHARVMSDAGKIGQVLSWELWDFTYFVTYIIFSLIVMVVINWKLALFVLILVPTAVLAFSFFEKKLLRLNREVREKNSQITGQINEGITGVKSIKTLVIENKMSREFKDETQGMRKLAVRTSRNSAAFNAVETLLGAIAVSLIIWKGGGLTMERVIEIGTLSVFANYALAIVEPIQGMVATISFIISIEVNMERYVKLMTTQGEVFDSPEVIEKYGDTFNLKKENWEPLVGEVQFKDVTFHYPDGEELVLEHFNLDVPQGTNVAIVGETGAGKSTLVNLVCRFFEPTEGKVLIDGKDVKERSLQWLHSNIGYVLQTPYLFSGTVRDNLIYGNPDATDEEIKEALRMVCADFVLDKLKDGLDTDIGEGGDFLSTGEKQLLSIARAMLADPRILILDEATSSIDTMTEATIQKAISKVIEGRTSFVIAHRLSTIVNADVILVVEDGKIIERGVHKELMEKKGYYYNLYTRQFEELVVDEM